MEKPQADAVVLRSTDTFATAHDAVAARRTATYKADAMHKRATVKEKLPFSSAALADVQHAKAAVVVVTGMAAAAAADMNATPIAADKSVATSKTEAADGKEPLVPLAPTDKQLADAAAVVMTNLAAPPTTDLSFNSSTTKKLVAARGGGGRKRCSRQDGGWG